MKILLATYSAANHLSYGNVTRELWKRLAKLNPDWKIVQHGWFHKDNEKVPWQIIPTKSQAESNDASDVYGQSSFASVVDRIRPDLVWTVSDAYMNFYMGPLRKIYKYKLIKHSPVDGLPFPKKWADTLADCDIFVPITRFGAKVLSQHWGGEVKPHIYHGVDTDRFVPMPDDARSKLRESLGFGPETIALGFVGNNQYRKMNWVMYPILAYLRSGAWVKCNGCSRVTLSERDYIVGKFGALPTSCRWCNSGDVTQGTARDYRLWLHCFNRDKVHWIPERMRDLWDVHDYVNFTNGMDETRGLPDEKMPLVYNGLDIFLMLSGGEGFGIPVLEAMACGVPVVYSNYSSHAEVAEFGAGVPVETQVLIPDKIEPIHRAIVDISDAVRRISALAENPGARRRMAQTGVTAAREIFSWDRIAVDWDRTIRRLPQGSPSIGVMV